MDDIDVKSELNRDQLEEMIAPFLGRLQSVLRVALEGSGGLQAGRQLLAGHHTSSPCGMHLCIFLTPMYASLASEFNFGVQIAAATGCVAACLCSCTSHRAMFSLASCINTA